MLQDQATVDSGLFIDFYKKAHCAETPEELCTELEKVITSFGFISYSVIYVPAVTETNFHPHFVASNWPKELREAFDTHAILDKSPLMARIRLKTTSITFDLETMTLDSAKLENLDEAQKHVRSMSVQHNRVRGAYFPCTDPRGQKGAVGVAGVRDLPSAEETSILHLISHFAFSHLHFLLNPNPANAGLTKREEDCLNWAARGKTNSECSSILGISENTVAGYLASTSRKLSARNKAHMIALAYENGLLNRHGGVQCA
jgi:LuxR family transcriptional regulator, quorum-sensing system regulator BjaR1